MGLGLFTALSVGRGQCWPERHFAHLRSSRPYRLLDFGRDLSEKSSRRSPLEVMR